jgi:hypothetical protein
MFRPTRNDLAKPKELGGHMRNRLRALLAASVSLWVMTATAQDESRPDESSKVGEVNFAVSCSLPAQQKFNRAVAILHSFWCEEAESAFNDVIMTDPSCAMGYWGIAMSNWHPLWSPPSAEELSAGSKVVAAATERAQAVSGVKKVHAVMGGFHLAPSPEDIDPDYIVPVHCSGEPFWELARAEMPNKLIRAYTGTRFVFTN